MNRTLRHGDAVIAYSDSTSTRYHVWFVGQAVTQSEVTLNSAFAELEAAVDFVRSALDGSHGRLFLVDLDEGRWHELVR